MGLFCMDQQRPQTRESLVNTAICNLELYLQEVRKGDDAQQMDYLLVMAQGYVEQVINKDFKTDESDEAWLNECDDWTRDDIV